MKSTHDCVLALLLRIGVLCLTCSALSAQSDLAENFVLVEGGTFSMGSSAREIGRDEDEGPRHQVTVASFALARTEVTRGEFAKFVESTGYRTDSEKSSTGCAPQPEDGSLTSWREPGWDQTDQHPVVCVSRNDAYAYAEWKGQQIDIELRLPTEAEFEYALRKPNGTTYPWGIDGERGCAFGNIGDINFRNLRPEVMSTAACNDGFTFTAPIGSFRPDGIGTVDLTGNVWEWTADCYADNYADSPSDSSAMKGGDCSVGVLRGASFDDGPRYQRSANRVGAAPERGAWVFGIRLAHDP